MMQLDYRPWVANLLIENVSVLIQCRNSVSRCPVMLFTGEWYCTTKKDKHIGIYSFLWLEGATVTIFLGWSKVGDQPIFVKKTPRISTSEELLRM